MFVFRLRQAGEGHQQRGDGPEGAGAKDAQPVHVSQDHGPGADVGQDRPGEGANRTDAQRYFRG